MNTKLVAGTAALALTIAGGLATLDAWSQPAGAGLSGQQSDSTVLAQSNVTPQHSKTGAKSGISKK